MVAIGQGRPIRIRSASRCPDRGISPSVLAVRSAAATWAPVPHRHGASPCSHANGRMPQDFVNDVGIPSGHTGSQSRARHTRGVPKSVSEHRAPAQRPGHFRSHHPFQKARTLISIPSEAAQSAQFVNLSRYLLPPYFCKKPDERPTAQHHRHRIAHGMVYALSANAGGVIPAGLFAVEAATGPSQITAL